VAYSDATLYLKRVKKFQKVGKFLSADLALDAEVKDIK